MKLTVRNGILIAFVVLIALTMVSSRIAHVFANKALLEEELKGCREDLEDVTTTLEDQIAQGREAEGLAFFDESSNIENVGRWDCSYAVCDSAGIVIAPASLAGKPLDYSIYQKRSDGIILGTYDGHKVAIIHDRINGCSYSVYGLYDKGYLLGDNHFMERSYRIVLSAIMLLLMLIAWVWVVPAVEHIIERRQSAEYTLSLARNIQRKAVTREFPSNDKVDSFAILNPMYEVGGDIFGCRQEGNKLYFVIGDVSGKGIEASFVMFLISSLVYPSFKRGRKPAEVASYLNEVICENRDYDMFCTMLLGIIDLDTREMEYCNAGHTKSLLNGEFLPQETNFVLGGLPGLPFASQKITIPHGSRLVFYTDGVTEARNEEKEFFGEDALLEWASQDYGTAQQTSESLLQTVIDFRGKAQQNDDIAIMTIRIL